MNDYSHGPTVQGDSGMREKCVWRYVYGPGFTQADCIGLEIETKHWKTLQKLENEGSAECPYCGREIEMEQS